MTYSETLNYLYNRLPVFQHSGQGAYKPGLQNALLLDEYLGQPHRAFRSIHVAGTNGKGSVSHLLAAVLQRAGYRVGLYTSPHLKDFRERIRINGNMIDSEYVINFVEENKALIEENSFSFFELTMSMAFRYFADEKIDVAVIETGLGGRLDSTNIIMPALCVITSISFDHTALLGNTLAAIAVEKAGIIKKNIPVVIGEAPADLREIFTGKANEENASAVFVEDECKALPTGRFTENTKPVFDCSGYPDLTVGLGGMYQRKNIATALTAVCELNRLGFDLSEKAVREGFATVVETTGLQGRWQILQQKPLVICDTGHNEAGIRCVVEQLRQTPHEHLHIVLGVVNDKDVRTMLSLLPCEAAYYFCRAQITRALPADDLQALATGFGLSGEAYPNVAAALQAAKEKASVNDLIFVGGSSFVVAEVL